MAEQVRIELQDELDRRKSIGGGLELRAAGSTMDVLKFRPQAFPVPVVRGAHR